MKIILMFIIIFIGSHSVAASQNCASFQDRINHLQNLNARGGKAKQLQLRREKIIRYEDALYNCKNKKKIAIVSNSPQINSATHYHKRKYSDIKNPQLQQLIKTCNYWIDQNKKKSSWDNANYRDTACRAADESKNMLINPAPKIAPNVRKIKDCIKPNNLIDDDVNACVVGNKDPSWNKK